MTEHTNDGWPDKYRDPRDRPHSDVLRVTVEAFDTMREDTTASVEATASGDSRPAVASFATVADLWMILTARRLELLQVLFDRDGAAESITTLADDLERDYRTVHDDVSLLQDHGLLFLIDEGQTKRPYVPYERIHLDVELVGVGNSEELATA